MAKDLYEVLGVARSASAEEIKQAYRKLSKELHPDKHKGDKSAEEKFKEVNKAYEVLGDSQKRQAYDQFGDAGVNGQGGGFNGAGFDFSGFSGGQRMDFSDLFENFFGGPGGRRRQQPVQHGDDREAEVAIEFADAVTGGQHTVRLRLLRPCSACAASGAKSGSALVTCVDCGGTGEIVRRTQSFFGMLQQSMQCPKCKGSGKIPEKTCSTCDGEGRKAEDVTITFDLPAGIADGQQLRLRGQADAGRQGAPSGDLYIRIHVRPDKRFVRDGDDIRSHVSITVPDAILGMERQIDTVYGSVTLKIPAGTQSGQDFRMKGKGMPVLNSSRTGDHYVTVTVAIPAKLSREERKLVEEWRALRK